MGHGIRSHAFGTTILDSRHVKRRTSTFTHSPTASKCYITNHRTHQNSRKATTVYPFHARTLGPFSLKSFHNARCTKILHKTQFRPPNHSSHRCSKPRRIRWPLRNPPLQQLSNKQISPIIHLLRSQNDRLEAATTPKERVWARASWVQNDQLL